MDYRTEFKRFITGQHLFRGIVVTVGALIPCILLFNLHLLGKMMALPLGALFLSLTDNPGPQKERIKILFLSLGIYVLVALITTLLRNIPFAVFIEIIVFSLVFSIIGVYGTRLTNMGTTALIIFTFYIDDHLSGKQFFDSALYFTIGGLWYILIFLLLNRIKPYLAIEQSLSEYLYDIGSFLKSKASYYQKNPDTETIKNRLITLQTKIRTDQDDLREMLFKTRELVNESTPRSRSLMFIFLDSIELFERIMTSQYDYEHLNKILEDSHIVQQFGAYISRLASEIQSLSLILPLEKPFQENKELDESFQKCKESFLRLRAERLSTENIQDFIVLSQILSSIEDLKNRIQKLQNATKLKFGEVKKDERLNINLKRFTPSVTYNSKLFWSSFSLSSNLFKHALRVTIALLIGYIVSLFLPTGHSYWLLLTIVVLLKPAYSLSKQRNKHRIIGTLVGMFLGLILITFISSKLVIFLLLGAFMTFGYSMLKINYMFATLGITVFVILAYFYLSPQNIHTLFIDRSVDTVVASVIVGLTSTFIFPVWEESQIRVYVKNALLANKTYFRNTADLLLNRKGDDEQFRLSRKAAFIELGNLSDNFQRMLSEPKGKRAKISQMHQFVATTHMMTSYIASLSYYAHTQTQNLPPIEIGIEVSEIEKEMSEGIQLMNSRDIQDYKRQKLTLPKNIELNNLIEKRKEELRQFGTAGPTEVGATLTQLQAIQTILELIYSTAYELNKILIQIIGK